MPNPQNLKAPWPKGQSGNPKGRPPQAPELRPLLARLLSEPSPEGVQALEAIIRSLIEQAAGGNVKAAELILKRAYGEATQLIEIAEPKPLSWLTACTCEARGEGGSEN